MSRLCHRRLRCHCRCRFRPMILRRWLAMMWQAQGLEQRLWQAGRQGVLRERRAQGRAQHLWQAARQGVLR